MQHNPRKEVMLKQTLPLIAALALGCSSGTQYERGAYTPPVRAPTFSPAEDAPHTRGQPGYINGQRVERSPNKRYVEPSREPQMMAADGDERRAVELMFNEPVPKETPPGIERKQYEQCWKDFLNMMRNERDDVLSFSSNEVRCLRNRVIAHCGARKIQKAKGDDATQTFEDYMADKDNEKNCGKRHQFWTDRVTKQMLKMEEFGEDVLGWRE